jgi:hypothetical protein
MYISHIYYVYCYSTVIYYLKMRFLGAITMVKRCVICGNVDGFEGVSMHKYIFF